MKPVRLFFALWPDAGARKALENIAIAAERSCAGRATQARNLHLTLAFLGDTEPAQLQAAIAAAAQVGVAPFELELDHCGFFKQGRGRGILWAGGDAPPQLQALSDELRARLAEAQVEFDAKPLVPHVTLLRDAGAPPEPITFQRIRWRITEFVLVASARDAAGSVYRVAAGPFGRIRC